MPLYIQAHYYHRRLTNVVENATREILATSSRGGAVLVHETRNNGGHLFAMDLTLVGTNYEISRQTVPANTLFLDALGLQTNINGVHENSQPSYDSFSRNLIHSWNSFSLRHRDNMRRLRVLGQRIQK